MSETYQFKIPFLEAAQAQKHVTVNEALAKFDALASLRVLSRVLDVPSSVDDGQAYIVPENATAEWVGQDGKIALFLNGGWEFVTPLDGWCAWVVDENLELRCEGGIWLMISKAQNLAVAMTKISALDFEHIVTGGATNVTTVDIPHHSCVIGVTARVTEAITYSGGTTTFRVGVNGSDNRYGSGYGHWKNTYVQGLTGQPMTYWSDTPILLSTEGGDFISGKIRFGIHLMELIPPAAV